MRPVQLQAVVLDAQSTLVAQCDVVRQKTNLLFRTTLSELLIVYHFYWPTNALNCIKLKG